jgi:hypothetical protein
MVLKLKILEVDLKVELVLEQRQKLGTGLIGMHKKKCPSLDMSQLQLDFGAPKIVQCSLCGLVYNRTNPTDAKHHNRYHYPQIRKTEAKEVGPQVYLVKEGALMQRLREWFSIDSGLFFVFGKRFVESILVLEEHGPRKILEYSFQKFKWKNNEHRLQACAVNYLGRLRLMA